MSGFRHAVRGTQQGSMRAAANSLDPALREVYAASRASQSGPAVDVPYPTPEQHARAEAEFRASFSRETGTAVRQPPTMLAAMQREDLSAEARGKVLRALAPPATLERKYKFLFDSSARSSALRAPLGGSFEVDVSPALLPTKVNGFELIGYSLPSAEWVVEFGEDEMPFRYGHHVGPRTRDLALRFEGPGVPAVAKLALTQPLYVNAVLEAEPHGGPLVRLRLEHPAGSQLAAIARDEPGALVLEDVVLPGARALGSEMVGEVWAAGDPREIVVRSAALAAALAERPSAGVRGHGERVGLLRARPPATAAALARRLSVQLRAAIAEAGDAVPVSEASVRVDEAGRFAVELWARQGGGGAGANADLAGIASGSPAHTSVSVEGTMAEATGLVGLAGRFGGRSVLTLRAPLPPTFPRALSRLRIPPVPDTITPAHLPSALNAVAASVELNPQPEAPDADAFAIPVRFAGGVHMVSVPAGEYASAGALAEAITRRAALVPALRPLRLRAAPRLEAGAGGDPFARSSEAKADSFFLGMSFAGAAPFGLAWQLADANRQVLDPARLGFRRIPYENAARYDGGVSSGADTSSQLAVFPTVDIAGAPAPLPTLPALVPAAGAAHARRLQLVHLPKPAPQITRLEGGHGIARLLLRTRRAVSLHRGQRLAVTAAIAPELLRFPGAGSAAAPAHHSGSAASDPVALARLLATIGASAADAGPAPPSDFPPPPPPPAAAVSLPLLLDFFAALHDPLAPSADALFEVAVRLLGAAGRAYGGRQVAGPMDSDGPYRVVLAGTAPASALAAVDALLEDLALRRRLRTTVNALALVLRRIIAAPPLNGTPLHLQPMPLGALAALNGGVASEGTALLLKSAPAGGAQQNGAQQNGGVWAGEPEAMPAAGAAAAAADRNVLLQIVAAAAPLLRPASLLDAAEVLQGVVYTFDPALHEVRIVGAGAGSADPLVVSGALVLVDGAALPLPGGSGSAPPSLQVVARGGGGGAVVHEAPLVTYRVAAGSGAPTSAPAASGARVAVDFDPARFAFAGVSAGAEGTVQGVEEPAVGRVVVQLRHNAPAAAAVLLFDDQVEGGTASLTLQLEDAPLTTLAKMLLVASSYVAALPAVAEVMPEAMPEAMPAAGPADVDVAAVDAGLPLWWPATEPAGRALLVEVLRVVLLTDGEGGGGGEGEGAGEALTTAAHLSRPAADDLPFSVDFASTHPRRVRPERLGMLRGAELASAAAPLGSLLAPFDLERGAPPYLLLSIAVIPRTGDGVGGGGAAERNRHTRAPPGERTGADTDGALRSLAMGSRGNATQLVCATAYVEVGGDGNALRLLDRQDDRAPVVFPTHTSVGAMRFEFRRPDGTLYDFHGRRAMVAVRFFAFADNPDAFALGTRD